MLAGANGKVLAIEPEPENLKLLNRNIQENGSVNVVVTPVAVGEKEVEATINVYKESSRGRHTFTPIKTNSSIVVLVKKVDDLVATCFPEGERIAFMKVDVEGL